MVLHALISPVLIVVCGPTAVGKTDIAIRIARLYDAEIISADSRQFYREMSIGTAKPDAQQLAAVVHHFINNCSIHNRHYSAGKYEAEVLEFLADYYTRKKVAVLVGGSGLFIQAVCSGFDPMDPKEEKAHYAARRFLNTKDIEWLKHEVERLDPEYYAIVDTQNPVRLKRALEVIYTTGKKYSEQRIGRKAERPFRIVKIGLDMPREALYGQINNRVEKMMASGLLAEAEQLYLHRKLPALNTVGYSELFDYIEDKLSLEEAIALIQRNTRQYAKRQMTWFRKDETIRWFHPDRFAEITHYLHEEIR